MPLDWTHTVHERYYGNLWLSRARDPGEEDMHWHNTIRCASFERTATGDLVVHNWSLSFDHSFEVFEADPPRNILFLLDTVNGAEEGSKVTIRYVALSDLTTRAH